MKGLPFFLFILTFLSTPCDAQVYKCKKPGGGFEITDIRCMDRMELTDDGWKKADDELPTEQEEKRARSKKRADEATQERIRFYSESAAAKNAGNIEGRAFAFDLKKRGLVIDHTACLAGSTVGAVNLPPGVAQTGTSRNAYGASFYDECMKYLGR